MTRTQLLGPMCPPPPSFLPQSPLSQSPLPQTPLPQSPLPLPQSPLPQIPAALANYPSVTAERLKNPADGDWLMIRRTYDGWGYSPLDQITPANAEKLAVKRVDLMVANDVSAPDAGFEVDSVPSANAPPIMRPVTAVVTMSFLGIKISLVLSGHDGDSPRSLNAGAQVMLLPCASV